jgi:hypothetical protein
MPKNKVAFLKALGAHTTAMVATQGLLVSCNMYSRMETIFLEEHGIVMP